jgi:hypothetical protein
MKQDASILNKGYELLKMMIPVIGKFPRDQKFLIGDRIQNQLADILELLIEAYYGPKTERKAILTSVNIKLEKLRFFLRLCYELGYFSSKQYKHLLEHIQELGRMTGGWLKSLK